MSSITFSVIDLTCDSADQTFFPPSVVMTTKSTTRIGTIVGFPEYIPSNPPKKYLNLAWAGSSEQQLWFSGGTPGNPGPAYQIGGARFDYSGSSQLDLLGNYLSKYSKDYSSMCNTDNRLVGILLPGVGQSLENYVFAGWLGPTGHEKCPPPGLPYNAVGNLAIGTGPAALNDSSTLWGSKLINPGNSTAQESNFVINSSTGGTCSETGTYGVICLFDPIVQGTIIRIDGTNQGIVWFFGYISYNHNYSSQLSQECTEDNALSVAQFLIGTGNAASNTRSGFTVSQTSVVFTINASNLIPGQNYTITYDLSDISNGTSTTVSVPFTADATTKSIIGSVAIPARGHSIVIRNPKIVFS